MDINHRKIVVALLASSALIAPSLADAQTAPPRFASPDGHGVDLTTGLPFLTIDEGGIGSGPGATRMQRIWAEGAGWTDNWSGGLYVANVGGVTKTIVQIGGISDTFIKSGSTYTSENAQGSTLVDTGGGNLLYTAADGTKITFLTDLVNAVNYTCAAAVGLSCQAPLEITRPNGLKFNYNWASWRHCLSEPPPGEDCINWETYQRMGSVTSSAGYSLSVAYASEKPPGFYQPVPPPDSWFQRTTVTFNNSASPPSPLPTVAYSYPNATTLDVTDPGGRTWRFTTDTSNRLTGVRRPGSAADNISYVYGGSGTVSSATRDGVTNTYARSVVGSTGTMTVTNPLAQQNVIISDLNIERPTSFKDGLNRTTAYQYDANARLTRVTRPEGNYVQLAYDSRGNVTTNTNVAKSGSGLANIVGSASYDATCANVVKCNQPNTTTDPKGNVTDYVYDATHGGVTSVTRPAPATGGIRPQTRYSYAQVTSASSDLVYMVTKVAACQTTASCTNLADEAQVTAGYNSNLLPTNVTRKNGTGTLTATSALTYYPRGNLNTVDGPLTGTADTSKYRYDTADQLIGVTSPDPDGASALKMRAIRLTYRPDGQMSKQELGTVNSQSDPDWTAFAPLQTVDMTFDTNSRVATRKLSASGTNHALTQTGYDALGRLDCSAVRMNPAEYASLPASACTLDTQGSFGPDRIGQLVYDAAGQITQNKIAVGTADAATERTLSYSSNAMLATLKDAENNLTTYEYDGFDRPSKTRFPSPTKGSGTSSTTDYEQLAYDANNNVTSRRLRDGQSIAFNFDNLNRTTLKNLPGAEPDVTYAYDNLGRITSASQTGNALSFTWDALSRNLTQVGPQGTASYQYDAADRRTQLTYPGTGLFVNTDYLVTGEVTKIRENGATTGVGVLATYAYDNLGNRLSTTFGNGAIQAFTYDPVSRLASLTNNLTGTANDLSATFSYNPASQIASTTRTGDAYAWTGHGSGSTAYVSNGLNQQTSIGGAAATWDTKGNLVTEPQTAKTYGYSSENLLISASGGVTLGYDPMLRLYQTVGAATTRFAYDGFDAIAEYNATNALQRRFVFDPSGVTGQAIVQYEGTGTTNRRFMSADERGSIISLTDTSGALINLNRYDEYGKPQSTNLGRYQYTGQKWIGEANFYDYKYRDYLPHLGIFAQTDPIGYGSGPNLYAYVRNDPVNLVDPLGLEGWCGGVWATVCGKRLPLQNGMQPGPASTGGSSDSSAGRGEGNEENVQKAPCTPTQQQLRDSGTVNYSLSENTATYGLLYSHIEGPFTTTGGYSGWFETSAKGLFFGKGTSVGMGTGTSQSLATFAGPNYNIVGNLGPVSISDNFSTTGSHVGQTDALATPGVGIGVTKSVTTLRNVQCPR